MSASEPKATKPTLAEGLLKRRQEMLTTTFTEIIKRVFERCKAASEEEILDRFIRVQEKELTPIDDVKHPLLPLLTDVLHKEHDLDLIVDESRQAVGIVFQTVGDEGESKFVMREALFTRYKDLQHTHAPLVAIMTTIMDRCANATDTELAMKRIVIHPDQVKPIVSNRGYLFNQVQERCKSDGLYFSAEITHHVSCGKKTMGSSAKLLNCADCDCQAKEFIVLF